MVFHKLRKWTAAACLAITSAAGAALLDVEVGFPLMVYNNNGVTTYDASSGAFSIDATPLALRLDATGAPMIVSGARSVMLRVNVDSAGNLLGGVPGDDFVVMGDVAGFSGVLLRGEVRDFGFSHTGTSTDFYDFRFDLTGGALASEFAGQDIGMTVTSEQSTFTGDFSLSFAGEAKGNIGATPGPRGHSCCEDGKPRQLAIRYTGRDCSASMNDQGADKQSCDGNPLFEPQVIIRASNKADPNDDDKIWFEGPVFLDGVFVMDAANAGRDHFDSNTWIHVFDTNGVLLQTINFHTSCSQPIAVGDMFGSAEIVGCVGEDEPIPGDCCDGDKPRVLIMQYTGDGCDASDHAQDSDKVACDGDPMDAANVIIRATDEEDPDDTDGKIWFEGPVALGGTYDIDAMRGGDDHLPSRTYIHVFDTAGNLLQSIEFHTSCSQPLFVGNQFGHARLVDCVGENEPVPGDCCADGNRPNTLVMQYTGEDCSASNNHQSSDKTECSGNPMGAANVIIRASNKENPDDDGAKVWFQGPVTLGGVFELKVRRAGEDRFDSATFIHVFDTAGNLLQSIEFHTSCSQPLILGDQFGSALLLDCSSEDDPVIGDCCDDGAKPRLLVMRYTGGSCNDSDNNQSGDKTSCSGDAGMAANVFIRASDKENPDDNKAKVWFEGNVALGDTYDIDAMMAGEDKLSSETWIHVYDTSGNLIQTIEFHTSCSQPIVIGDIYGSAELIDCIDEDEPVAGDCCASGVKPRLLVFRYTGEFCGASSNAQGDKAGCTGDPSFAPEVMIRASDSDDPNDGGADVYFEGIVALDATFEVDAANAGGDRFASNSWVHVFDSTSGDLLQTIKYHTSCSVPLFVGNQFGSLLLEACSSDTPSDGDSVCRDGKPRALIMRYDGADCSASSNSQDASKWSCDGDPAGAGVVTIRASDSDDPADTSAQIWFDGVVALGDTFAIDAANGGATRLRSNTWVHLFDVSGNVVQTLRFHTSCSQPLFRNDRFGSLELLDFIRP